MKQVRFPSFSGKTLKVFSLVAIVTCIAGCGPIRIKYRLLIDSPASSATIVNVQQLHFLSGESYLEIRFEISNNADNKLKFELSPHSRIKSSTCEYEFTQLLVNAMPSTDTDFIEVDSKSKVNVRLTYRNRSFEGSIAELRKTIENEKLEVSAPLVSDSMRFVTLTYVPIVGKK